MIFFKFYISHTSLTDSLCKSSVILSTLQALITNNFIYTI